MKLFHQRSLGIGALIGLCAGAVGQQAPVVQRKSWFQNNVIDRLTWSGSRTLGYQMFRFDGDEETFRLYTNAGTGGQTFTDIGSLTVNGTNVLGFLNFNAAFVDNRFADPEQQQYNLLYKRNAWELGYGTVRASITSNNPFVSFNRSLDGSIVGFKQGRFEGKLIQSETRGAAETITIEGNNTSGPYFLQSGRVIPDSIQVQVDGVSQILGVDYTANYSLGNITFVKRVIAPTSSINVSFESYDIGGSRGTIRGAGTSYDFGWAGRVGFTLVEQLTGDANANPDRDERSFGFGRPGDQYFLQFEPDLTFPIRVQVNGIPRSFSVGDDGISDFFIDPKLPILIISRVAIPTTQEIIFTYRPKLVNAASGDRRVSGFDYRLPVGNSGRSFLNYSQAYGEQRGLTPVRGKAETFGMRLDEGKGEFEANFRKIDPGFRTVEQTGFNRNEDSVEYKFDYYTKGLRSQLRTANSAISLLGSDATLSTTARSVRQEAIFSYTDPSLVRRASMGGVIGFGHSQSLSISQTRTTADSDSFLSTVGFTESYQLKKFTFSGTVENQIGFGRINGTQSDVGINTFRTGVGYAATAQLGLNLLVSQSRISAGSTTSTGYDYSLNANLLDIGPWSGSLGYALSDSGTLASLTGFLNGNGIGFGGSGFAGGTGGGTVSTGQLKSKRLSIAAEHRINDRLSFNVSHLNQDSEGLSTSNASLVTTGFSTSWIPNNQSTLSLDYFINDVNYRSGSVGNTGSTSFTLYYSTSPSTLWNFNLGVNSTKSTGGTFAQSSDALNFDAGYRINDRQRLFFGLNAAKIRGDLSQDDIGVNAGYSYRIFSGIFLTGRYTLRDLANLDSATTAGAFRSNGLSLELTLDLSRGR